MLKIHEFACRARSKPHRTSCVEHCTAGRLIRRKAIIAAAISTHPYSSSITQPGSAPPRTPECAEVPLDVCGDNAHSPDDDEQRRGRHQKWQQPEQIPWEYGGCAQKRSAIGQANTSGEHSGAVLLSQIAVTNPTSTASPASNCGGTAWSRAANADRPTCLTGLSSDDLCLPFLCSFG